METQERTDLAALVASLGLVMRARFVPQSQSRNAKERIPSLNWRVEIGHPARCPHGAPGCACAVDKLAPGYLETDYMQGIGHIPGWRIGWEPRSSVDQVNAERYTAEHGRYGALGSLATTKLPAPALLDVLHCLVMDAGALDFPRFEDWAADLGEDPDSRRAERAYAQCLAIGLQLRALVGDSNLAALRAAFQDY